MAMLDFVLKYGTVTDGASTATALTSGDSSTIASLQSRGQCVLKGAHFTATYPTKAEIAGVSPTLQPNPIAVGALILLAGDGNPIERMPDVPLDENDALTLSAYTAGS